MPSGKHPFDEEIILNKNKTKNIMIMLEYVNELKNLCAEHDSILHPHVICWLSPWWAALLLHDMRYVRKYLQLDVVPC